MQGVNNWDAMKLYEAVKGFMGAAESSSTKSSKGRRNKKNKAKGAATKSSVEPCFLEQQTPQQSNGYDCGLYVMAIAHAICQWHSSEKKRKKKKKEEEDTWFAAVEEHVNGSVELNTRTEVLRLVEDLRVDARGHRC